MTSWVFAPILLVYTSLSLILYPYARPLLPVWIILFAVILPPLFPFLLFYVLFFMLVAPTATVVPERASPQKMYIVQTGEGGEGLELTRV